MIHMIQATAVDVPWSTLTGASAAVLVIGVVVIFLRHLADLRKEEAEQRIHDSRIQEASRTQHNETVRSMATEFAGAVKNCNETIKSAHDTFAETSLTILKESRAAHQKCEDTIYTLLQNHGKLNQ